MPLKAIVSEVPEGQAGFYKPVEGQDNLFVLDVESVNGYALENIEGLKSALAAERSAREKAEKTAKSFEGLDASEIQAKLSRLEELEALDPSKEADKIAAKKVEAATQQLVTKHQEELAKRDQTITRYRSAIEDRELRAAAIEAISKEKGVPDLLLPHVMNSARLRETDDGKFIVEVLDKDGNVRIGDGAGNPMTLPGLVQEMKKSETFARAFEGSGSSGSGTQSGGGTGGGGTGTKSAAEMSLKEKTAFITKHGVEAWSEKINSEVGQKKAS